MAVYRAANQAAMLALSTAVVGDYAARTDLQSSMILTALPPATLGNWSAATGAWLPPVDTDLESAFTAQFVQTLATLAPAGAVTTEATRALTAEALLAPKASPALTGTPTAPTATALDNSTKVSTTAYVDAATAVEKARALTAEALLASTTTLTARSLIPTATKVNNYTAQPGDFVMVDASSRTVADGVLNSTTTITSATASFVALDVGRAVVGTGIPANTTVASVTNGTTIILSAAATATASGVTLTFGGAFTVTAPSLVSGYRWGIRYVTASANAVTASTGSGTFDTTGTTTLPLATGYALLDVTWAANAAATQWVGTSSGKPNAYLASLSAPTAANSGTTRNPLTGFYHMAATCDRTGVTDCTSALQTLANAVATAGGGTIYADPGVYRMNSSVVWPAGSVSLRGGAGRGDTVFMGYNVGTTMFHRQIADGATSAAPIHDCAFRDFSIDGSNMTVSGAYSTTIKGMDWDWLQRVTFENLYIHHTGATGLGSANQLDGVVIHNVTVANCGRLNDGTNPGGNGLGIGSAGTSDTEQLLISDCTTINNKRFGIFIEAQAGGSGNQTVGGLITGCWSSGNQVGIGDCGNQYMVIANNQCTGNSVAGIAVNGGTWSAGQPGLNGLIIGNQCWANSGPGILLDYSGHSQNGKYVVRDNACAINTGEGIRVKSDTQAVTTLVIDGNVCHDNTLSGIALIATSTATLAQCDIANNVCYNNGTTATAGNKDGIRIAMPCTDVHLTNNRCYDRQVTKTQDNGIITSASATFTGGSVTGNKARGNLTAGGTFGSAPSATTCVARNEGIPHPAPASVTVTASPMTYTAPAFPSWLAITGGTVSSVTVAGVTVAAASETVIPLEASDSVVITYSSAPTMASRAR